MLRSIINDIDIIIQLLIEKGLITEDELNEKRKIESKKMLELLQSELNSWEKDMYTVMCHPEKNNELKEKIKEIKSFINE